MEKCIKCGKNIPYGIHPDYCSDCQVYPGIQWDCFYCGNRYFISPEYKTTTGYFDCCGEFTLVNWDNPNIINLNKKEMREYLCFGYNDILNSPYKA